MADATPTVFTMPSRGQFASVPYNQTYGGQPAPYNDLSAQILDTMRMSQLLPGYPKNPMSFAPDASGNIVGAPNGAGRYSFGGGGGTFDGNYGLLGGGKPAGQGLAPGAGGPPGANGAFITSRAFTPGAPTGAPGAPGMPGAPQGGPAMPPPQGGLLNPPAPGAPLNTGGFANSTAGYGAPTTPAPAGALQDFLAGTVPLEVSQAALLNDFGGNQTAMNQYRSTSSGHTRNSFGDYSCWR